MKFGVEQSGATARQSSKSAPLAREHPILFSAPMIRALLEDHKFVTRRLSKQWLKVKAGDRLWVRENFRLATLLEDIPAGILTNSKDAVQYVSDQSVRGEPIDDFGRLRIARFMPRWASRILLECEEDARVERLQDITEGEAVAEGVEPYSMTAQDLADMQISDASPQVKDLARLMGPGQFSYRFTFEMLWDELHTKPGERWPDNPEVVRVGRFHRVSTSASGAEPQQQSAVALDCSTTNSGSLTK